MNNASVNNLGGARLSCLDIAKGFGIICVVLGHTIPFCPLYYWMYGFHVPLFFVISGMVCNYDKYCFKCFLYKRIKTLAIPFFFWHVLQMILVGIVRGCGQNSLKAVWFILILFMVEVFFYFLYKWLGRFTFFTIPISLIFALIFEDYNIRVPYRLATIPAGLFFFGIGYCYKESIKKSLKWISESKKNSVPWIIVLFTVSLIRVFLAHKTELASNSFVFSDYVISLSGVGFVLFSACVIGRLRILEYYGRNTLVILGTHVLVIIATVDLLEPLISNHWVFKTTQLLMIWSVSVVVIEIVNKYLPWAAGKIRKG